MFVYIFGYGGNRPQGSPLKVTTMKTYSSIDPIIEQLLIEFEEEVEKYRHNNENNNYSDSAFEAFITRWKMPPKVYISELDNPNFKAKLITQKKWMIELNEFSRRCPEKVAKLMLSGDIHLDKQLSLDRV